MAYSTQQLAWIYQNIEGVRGDYFERYNQHWLSEKNGYRSPTWVAATITTHEAA